MIRHNYISDFNGDLRVQDATTRIYLSDYTHKNLWVKVLKHNDKFQHDIMNDVQTYIVWPVGKVLSVDDLTKFRNFETCGSYFQNTWNCPCEH